MSLKSLLAASVLALVAATATTPARAASWLEMNFGLLRGPGYDGVVPSCDWGLGTISSRFRQKEWKFWASDAVIEDFAEVRELAFRPFGKAPIPRRYCEAKALVASASFGQQRWTKVYFSIAEDQGFAGFTWGVTWCVVGMDRNLAYAPECKQARP
jgi:hypothetical protein